MMNLSRTFATTLLHPFSRWAASQPKGIIFAICTLLICVVGFVDSLVGREITISVIYAIPISIAAWFLGRIPAIALAVLSVALWIYGDIATGVYIPGIFIPLLNGTFRFAFYLLLITVLLRLSNLQRTLEERAALRGAALVKETAERERLEREMLDIGEQERQRFGQDIHDGLCQHLTGTALAGHVLAERLAIGGAPESGSARKIVSLIEEAIVLARGMAKGLYPVQTEPVGLMLALDEFSSTTSHMFGVDCRFECHSPVLVHTVASATHLYRIAQEAVGNAIKHGGATQITVLLEEGDMGLRLMISDNGKGFDPGRAYDQGMGLRIMSDRAKVIGGHLSKEPRAQGGTEVTCIVPAIRYTDGMHV